LKKYLNPKSISHIAGPHWNQPDIIGEFSDIWEIGGSVVRRATSLSFLS